jgi:hypothetical protein
MKKPRRFITYNELKMTKSEAITDLENHGNGVRIGYNIGCVEYIGETGVTVDWFICCHMKPKFPRRRE